MIYFLQGEFTRRIKIGFTTRFIESRLRVLQIGSPDKLIFLGAHSGDVNLESDLHFRFKKSYSHGEWFNESPDILNYIKSRTFKDMDIAHSADSLVLDGVLSHDDAIHLQYEAINIRYMEHLAKKLG